jgi:hypothetical protein
LGFPKEVENPLEKLASEDPNPAIVELLPNPDIVVLELLDPNPEPKAVDLPKAAVELPEALDEENPDVVLEKALDEVSALLAAGAEEGFPKEAEVDPNPPDDEALPNKALPPVDAAEAPNPLEVEVFPNKALPPEDCAPLDTAEAPNPLEVEVFPNKAFPLDDCAPKLENDAFPPKALLLLAAAPNALLCLLVS